MDDITFAQQIVGGKINNITKQIYHNSSFVFPTTNEKINLLKKYFENKKDITCVTASGDQILNTILWNDETNITSFDISIFPKYFLELKKAAIMSLEINEYIDFFFIIDPHKDEIYDELYCKIRLYLEGTSKEFWDSLLNFYDWSEINNSTLFSSQTYQLDTILKFNDYLNEKNYIILKEKLKKVNISYITSDVLTLKKYLDKKQDIIYLSSILYYIKNYHDIVTQLMSNLKDNGLVLSYLYGSGECEFGKVKKLGAYNDSILIHKKSEF